MGLICKLMFVEEPGQYQMRDLKQLVCASLFVRVFGSLLGMYPM